MNSIIDSWLIGGGDSNVLYEILRYGIYVIEMMRTLIVEGKMSMKVKITVMGLCMALLMSFSLNVAAAAPGKSVNVI